MINLCSEIKKRTIQMKKLFTLFTLAGVFTFVACTKEEDPTPGGGDETTNEVISGAITADATWTADKIYELASKVVVTDGATLTIEPGTIIKGRTGSGSLATALLVARGGKVIAEGTADKPIIFTSEKDNIKVGELSGTNLTNEDIQLWGGLIILGNAPISAKNGDTEAQIEGIPADDTFGLYGGSVANDNSGSYKYISVRHGGALIGEGNEINGITLGGVGSGTIMDYIEVYATFDDGIEFFGGTVNVSNAIVSHQGDDGLDIDQNYAGTITNFLVQHGVNGTDEGLEIDGPEGSTHVDGLFTLKNGTVKALSGTDASQADLKSKAQGTIENVVFVGYTSGKDLVKIAVSYTNNCEDSKTDAFTHYTANPATLKLVASNFNDIKLYTKSEADDASICPVKDADKTAAAGISISDVSATGANVSVFENWTVTDLSGEL